MLDSKPKFIQYLDYIIFFFIIIFLLSLSNSIFLNQLGYYGALVFILIKAFVIKENPFNKTGLEFALVWYICAEILSTIFSSDISASFHNLLKRVFLIPIIYFIAAYAIRLKDIKKIFIIYIAGTLVTVLIYLYFSAEYFVKGLYSVEQSGPSIFQYPITASEIISFTVIFLFAFFINEKTSIRNRIFLFIGFALSIIALFSTYKRTGWMGAAFGILVILIIKKQWKIIIGGMILVGLFFLTQKNISEVKIYLLNNASLVEESTIKTEGKAYTTYNIKTNLVVCDYNKGLLVYQDTTLTEQIQLPHAVTGFYHWRDNFYLAALADTRYILLKNKSGNFKTINELYSPGFTTAQATANGYFYVLDKDSGLTIFTDPNDLKLKLRYPAFTNKNHLFVDSTLLFLANQDSGFVVYKLNNGLPVEILMNERIKFSFVNYSTPYLFIEDKNGLKVYQINDDKILLIKNFASLHAITNMHGNNDEYVLANNNNKLFFLNKVGKNDFALKGSFQLSYSPFSLNLVDNKIYTTRVESKQSRLLEIFDPYHPSNFTRIALWQAGIKIFLAHPVFGVGDIDLANYYKMYKKPYHKEIQGHLHNNFFHILATLGIFGLLAVVFLFIKIILIDIKVLKQVKDIPFVSSYSLGTLAAFCGFLVSGLTELNFWDHEITTLIWFTFGLNIALLKSVLFNNIK